MLYLVILEIKKRLRLGTCSFYFNCDKRNFIIVEINYIIIHYIANNRVNSLKSLTKCNSCCQYVKYHIISESESTAPAAIFFYDFTIFLRLIQIFELQYSRNFIEHHLVLSIVDVKICCRIEGRFFVSMQIKAFPDGSCLINLQK